MSFCTQCGNGLPPDAAYCPGCGRRVDSEHKEVPLPGPSTEFAERPNASLFMTGVPRRHIPVFPLGLGLLVLVVVGVVGWRYYQIRPALSVYQTSISQFPTLRHKINGTWFRYVGQQWVIDDGRNAENCTGQDAAVNAGQAFYPEMCLPTPEEAQKADRWRERTVLGWSSAQIRAHEEQVTGQAPQATTAQRSEQPSDQPESLDDFLTTFDLNMRALTNASSDLIDQVGRQEYARCTAAGFRTRSELNDCILNHPDEGLVERGVAH